MFGCEKVPTRGRLGEREEWEEGGAGELGWLWSSEWGRRCGVARQEGGGGLQLVLQGSVLVVTCNVGFYSLRTKR